MSRVEETKELLKVMEIAADVMPANPTMIVAEVLTNIAMSLAVIADAMKKGEE